MILPAADQSAEVVQPSEEAFDFPAAAVSTEFASFLGAPLAAVVFVRGNKSDAMLLPKVLVERIAVISAVADHSLRRDSRETLLNGGFHQCGFMRRSAGDLDDLVEDHRPDFSRRKLEQRGTQDRCERLDPPCLERNRHENFSLISILFALMHTNWKLYQSQVSFSALEGLGRLISTSIAMLIRSGQLHIETANLRHAEFLRSARSNSQRFMAIRSASKGSVISGTLPGRWI